jgi:hypothetical protein
MNHAPEAHEFLLSVMHDSSVDLMNRIEAAGKLVSAGLGDIPHVRTLHIHIDCGYIPTAEELREVLLLQRIYASGQTLTSLGWDGSPMRYILSDMQVKGHA